MKTNYANAFSSPKPKKEENKQKHKKDELGRWWVDCEFGNETKRLTRPSILLQEMLQKQKNINNSQKTLDTFLMMRCEGGGVRVGMVKKIVFANF
jgi:hypothetical protein